MLSKPVAIMESSLLPESANEFCSVDYWDRFFSAGKVSDFEWYADMQTLKPIIDKYARLISQNTETVKMIVPGCGLSEMSCDLYDADYKNLYAFDFSDVALDLVRKKAELRNSTLQFHKRDACCLSQYNDADATFWFKPNSVSVIVDKGLLDSISSDMSNAALQACATYLKEMMRLISRNGTFIVVTMAQTQVLDLLFDTFLLDKWRFVVHFLDQSRDNIGNRCEPVAIALTLATEASRYYFSSSNCAKNDSIEQVTEYSTKELLRQAIADRQQKNFLSSKAVRIRAVPSVQRSYRFEVKPASVDTDVNIIRQQLEQLVLKRFPQVCLKNVSIVPFVYGLKKLVVDVLYSRSGAESADDIELFIEELQEDLGDDLVQSVDLVDC